MCLSIEKLKELKIILAENKKNSYKEKLLTSLDGKISESYQSQVVGTKFISEKEYKSFSNAIDKVFEKR